MKKFPVKSANSTDPNVDVILMILKGALSSQPASTLLNSFMYQYQERGSLSKKQLEGLLSKATKCQGVSPAHLATLEAIILKKPTRYKTEPAATATVPTPDADIPLIADILCKYPQHKRVLYFDMKTKNREVLSTAEKDELRRFAKLLLKVD